ncbi:MAG: hypothetical protein WC942_04030 [Clostridia bacterium]|jgi:hypothetical protein
MKLEYTNIIDPEKIADAEQFVSVFLNMETTMEEVQCLELARTLCKSIAYFFVPASVLEVTNESQE